METGCCLGSEGEKKWGQFGGREWGGPGPPERGKDKQSMPSKARDNMGKDEEEQSNQTWWRRSSPLIELYLVNMITDTLSLIIVSFFQENKSCGIKTICIDPLSTCHCTSHCEQIILSGLHYLDELRMSWAGRTSRRVERSCAQLQRTSQAEGSFGSSHVKGNMHHHQREQTPWQRTKSTAIHEGCITVQEKVE
jgi:hypothetical protein